MSPIKIIPEIEVYVSEELTTLNQAKPTLEPRVVNRDVYILPCGKTEDYIVRVEGFPNSPGGIIETERLTSGQTKDDITLTTLDDSELSGQLGVTGIKIDGVFYEAMDLVNETRRNERC